MEKHEFDHLAQNYREILDEAVSLSGETGEFFAMYKAYKLGEWMPHLRNVPIALLDFGCGIGHMTHHVQEVFLRAHVYGVDPSGESIDVARRMYSNITFEKSDTIIPYADATFDLIFAASVFHHIEFSDHHRYYDEIFRVLKKGGVFVMFELNSYNPLTVKTFNSNPIDKNAKMLTTRYACRMLASYGKVTLKYYCFFPKMLSWMRPCEKYLTKLPLGALYATLVVK